MEVNLNNLMGEHLALAEAADSIEAGNTLYQMTVKQLQVVDKIAEATESLRAIQLSAQLKKDVASLIQSRQAYQSKQALLKAGIWQQMFKNEADFHIAVITGTIKEESK
jgi:hypothetical protein